LDKVKYKESEVSKDVWGKRTIGFSGADIKNFVNLAILNAIKTKGDTANGKNFDFAFDRILMGINRPGLLVDEEDKVATAFHEVGHALVSFLRNGPKSLYKMTILPKGNSLGHTALLPDENETSTNNKKLLNHVDVALGGRASEELFLGFDHVTTGCSSD